MITKSELDELFLHCHETGNLIRKVRTARRTQVGDIAGSYDKYGYKQVKVKGKIYRAHRLVWIMIHGSIDPKLSIDHIDGVKDNNRINNLRLVTHQDNHKNIKTPSHNTSGHTGVSWNKAISKWAAYISIGGKQEGLGVFTNKEDAIKVRAAAEIKHNYHPNHGRNI
tara:strand:+ start:704 stop:1204 length:501 start_codon:yes stop_codon:yes gene_type:complete